MKNCQVYSLAFVAAMTGCSAQRLHEFVTAPEPPLDWKITLEKEVICPDATGKYASIPRVADLQKDGSWRISDGTWYDFILLTPSDRVPTEISTPFEKSATYSVSSLIIESKMDGQTLRVTNPDKNGEKLSKRVFSTAEDDYECKDGSLVFPAFEIQGGTEGAYLNGKIFRQANITSDGDLLFYEQVQSHKVVHKYYLFKSLKGEVQR